MSYAVKSPLCPGCDGAPAYSLIATWPEQAWCANAHCAVVMWNATLTLDENLTRASELHIDWRDARPEE